MPSPIKNFSLSFKFTLMLIGFILISLIFSSVLSYMNQMHLYKSQREENIQYIANYLESRIVADGPDFLNFQKYFLEHYKELRIKPNFDQTSVDRDRELYETLFAQTYPGKTLDFDIDFDDLTDEIKKIYTIYCYKYYSLMFEEAAKAFNVTYTYYVTPVQNSESDKMYWVIISLRESVDVDGQIYLLINDIVENTHENNPQMWEAWDTGKRPKGYKIYDNEYGKTYAYYTPLFVKGRKLGVIGVEVDINSINIGILRATSQQMLMIGGVLVLLTLFLLLMIRNNYIHKLVKLRNIIEKYSNEKNPEIAEVLRNEVTNNDEISQLMGKFSDMIYQLELYIQNLQKTQKDLQNTRLQAIQLNELAIKDSLTGIRNKTAFDMEIQHLSWKMREGLIEVGVAMVDLNFLKKINDTYGHDKGNTAIIYLSRVICRIFEHSPVFRIGGDEFVVILKGRDYNHIEERVADFRQKIFEIKTSRGLESWEKISAAIGYAIYDPKQDSNFDDILRRADAEMYKAKKAMKAERKE